MGNTHDTLAFSITASLSGQGSGSRGYIPRRGSFAQPCLPAVFPVHGGGLGREWLGEAASAAARPVYGRGQHMGPSGMAAETWSPV